MLKLGVQLPFFLLPFLIENVWIETFQNFYFKLPFWHCEPEKEQKNGSNKNRYLSISCRQEIYFALPAHLGMASLVTMHSDFTHTQWHAHSHGWITNTRMRQTKDPDGCGFEFFSILSLRFVHFMVVENKNSSLFIKTEIPTNHRTNSGPRACTMTASFSRAVRASSSV